MRVKIVLSCLLLLFRSVCCDSDNEETWVDPHVAWSWAIPELNTDTCQCAVTPETLTSMEDAVALMYFKKFVNLLFQRKRLQYDATSTLYKRSLLFRLLPAQLEELEAAKDARDLDIFLSNILENAEAAPLLPGGGGCSYTYFHWVPDIFTDFLQLTKQSEVRLLLKILLVIAVVWLVHKRAGVGALTVIIGGVVLYGYFITYLECNRKLEVDAMIEVMDNDQEALDYSSMSWGMRAWNYVTKGSQETQLKNRLRKSAKLNMTECRLDHVFILYLNDLFLKQLEMLLERVTETMTKLTNDLSFPYNYIAPVLLLTLVGYIIKLTFKYIFNPKAWISLLHSKSAPSAHRHPLQHQDNIGDRLSGENLKMLLNVINVTNTQQTQQLPAVSGVQELIETPAIESKVKPANESSGSNKSTSTDIAAQDAGFTLIDDPDSNDVVDEIDHFSMCT